MLGGTVMEYIAAEAESPIEKGDFLSFTKREAEIYFNWYIEHIDERIEYLCEYVHSQGQSIELDFSVNSIIEIWDWYVKQIKIERYTRSELEEIAKEYNEEYDTNLTASDISYIKSNPQYLTIDEDGTYVQDYRQSGENNEYIYDNIKDVYVFINKKDDTIISSIGKVENDGRR